MLKPTQTILFLWLVACSSVSFANEAKTPSLPNFIIIMADDLGYGDLSCYGNKSFKTPRLDQLAKEGLSFTDFHSSGPVCSPTRAGLMTGRYQQRASVPGVINADPKKNRHHGLQLVEKTIAEYLKKAGYTTGCFGKWHLGYLEKYNPVHQGFDTFKGYVSGNIDFHNHLDRMGFHDWWENTKRKRVKGYSTHLITKNTIEFIQENHKKPFFAYVAHEAPHTPYQGPNDPAFRVEGKAVGEPRSREFKLRALKEMIQEMDKGIGEIVDKVKELGIEKNTLVMFFSDNGATSFGFNGVLRGTKGQLFEGGHREPAIAWWPGKIEPDTKTDAMAITLDITPTLLDLAGVQDQKITSTFDGKSLKKVFLNNGTFDDRALFWEFGKQRAARIGDWKYIQFARNLKGPGLFNLKTDLSEKNNLAKQHPERLKALMKAWENWKKTVSLNATPQSKTSPYSKKKR